MIKNNKISVKEVDKQEDKVNLDTLKEMYKALLCEDFEPVKYIGDIKY